MGDLKMKAKTPPSSIVCPECGHDMGISFRSTATCYQKCCKLYEKKFTFKIPEIELTEKEK